MAKTSPERMAKIKAWKEANPEKFRESMRLSKVRQRWRLKLEVLKAYGGECTCCGETQPEFLAIDHMEGNGRQQRLAIHPSRWYKWLKDNGWPAGFQVLCHNCNMAKHHWGECPHARMD